jgi:AcrR family transcriptional regulator
MDEGQPGLRARKKSMARETIANAALALTLERGLANVTLEEVGRIAFVSPRTVSNYFSCKEEAVVAAGNEFNGLLEQFSRAPDDEPSLHVLRREVTDFLRRRTPVELEESRGRVRLLEENPSLVPFQVAAYHELEREFRSIIVQRSGSDLSTDMHPWLVASAAMAAARIALRVWAESRADAELLPALVASAFDQIEGGLRLPDQPGLVRSVVSTQRARSTS